MGTRLGRALLVRWAAALVVVAGACVLSVRYLDQPVAAAAAAKFGFPRPDLLSYPWLTLALMFAVLVIAERTAEGRDLSRLSRVLVLAGFALAWGLCTTEFLLKPLFGRLPPTEWFLRGAYAFRWLTHSDDNSFPSGHAVQLAAIGTILWGAYPRWRWFYVATIGIISAALVAGNWHYASDVIAGLFVGVTAGQVVQAIWNRPRATTFDVGSLN